MKVSGKTFLFILIWSGFSAVRCGATVYHSNGSVASVQGLHNAAQNGDTITLPAGTFTWSTTLTINRAITLQGAGIGATIIRDNASNVKLIDCSLVASQLTRITGIEFQDGGRTPPASAPGGIIHIEGRNTNGSLFRFDHCKWTDLNGFFVPNTVIGVVDHNIFTVGNHVYEWMYPYGSAWNDGVFGDGSWDTPVNWGSAQFLFIEDNTGNCTRTQIECSLTDGFNGARFVVRHNNLSNFNIGDHGTESPGRGRSSRAKDIYDNVMDGRNVNRFPLGTRGGTTLFHDNTLTRYQGANALNTLSSFRMQEDFNPWGGADGRNGWDRNNAGNPFATLTATAVATRSVTVAGNPWTAGQWNGYTLHRTAGANNDYGYINGNTSNTVTYDSGGFGRDMVPAVGDTFEINKEEASLDQPGAGVSSAISTSPNPTPPPNFTQGVDPCYAWNNTNGGQPFNNFSPDTSNIKPGINYFNNTAKPGYSAYTYPHPLVTGAGAGASRAVVRDFNGDSHPDYVLQNVSTRQTAIWYLNNNVYVSGAYGPTRPAGWALRGLADFNGDSHSDYALFAPNTNQTALWYLSGPILIAGAYGPTLPNGWELVGTADCNGDSRPDYVLNNSSTHQTAIWYLHNNVYIGGGFGPTLPNGWRLAGVADFNGDGHPDYVLFYPSTGFTAIWYLSGRALVGGAWGPTIPSNWALVATGDFNGDGHPDYVVYNAGTRQTAIWYLINNVYVSAALGPTISFGWSLTGP